VKGHNLGRFDFRMTVFKRSKGIWKCRKGKENEKW
jgi:hypothetical protein